MNTIERSVIKGDQHVELTTKTFDVLLYLIENAGNIVTKDELLGAVWTGSVVEESNLPVHISKLRRSLGETRRERYIETIQGVGYRFLSPVFDVNVSEWNEASDRAAWQGRKSTVNPAAHNSIAVLPLENASADPSLEYLVDGLTEGLINGFSHSPGLKVIAREAVFRYKEKDVDLKEVAELLAVSKILTGRVRLQGENLVVGVELINASDRVQLWGDQFDRAFSEIVAVQNAIVAVVSARLFNCTSNERRSALPSTENAESYRYYLMGMYLLRKRTTPELRKAIQYFQRSVSHCATNVHSYVGIVETYLFLHALERLSRSETFRNIKPVLDLVVQISPTLDVVHLMYGKLALCCCWNVIDAEAHFRKALSLNPNSVVANCRLAEVMIVRGNRADALFHTRQVLTLDPISLDSLKQVGRLFYKLELFEQAIAYLTDAFEMEPGDSETLLLLGAALAETGEYTNSIELLERSYRVHSNIEALSMIGYVQARSGKKVLARQTIERIESELKSHDGHPINLSRIYMAIGDKETAYELLNEAYEQRCADLYGLTFDPRWKQVRSESRFKKLIERVGSAATSLDELAGS